MTDVEAITDEELARVDAWLDGTGGGPLTTAQLKSLRERLRLAERWLKSAAPVTYERNYRAATGGKREGT